jgi:hypothetical protein
MVALLLLNSHTMARKNDWFVQPGTQGEEQMKLDVDFDKIPVGDSGRVRFRFRDIAVEPGKAVSLKKDFDPDFTGGYDDKAGASLNTFPTSLRRSTTNAGFIWRWDISARSSSRINTSGRLAKQQPDQCPPSRAHLKVRF